MSKKKRKRKQKKSVVVFEVNPVKKPQNKIQEVSEFINNRCSLFARRIKETYLPQIYRFIPARYFNLFLKTIFWAIIFGFLFFNFLPLPYSQNFIVKNNPEEHIKIAEKYLKNNDYNNAIKEYKLALNSKSQALNSEQILNIKNLNFIKNKIAYINNLINQNSDFERETTKWEKILREKPDYRDAYLKLAMLNFQLKRPLTAKKYLEKAIEIDPNFQLTNQLKEVIK